jgi:hypothetical protein
VYDERDRCLSDGYTDRNGVRTDTLAQDKVGLELKVKVAERTIVGQFIMREGAHATYKVLQ